MSTIKACEVTGSVRADLVGGTLDLEPICLLLDPAYTINLALTLKASAQISGNGGNQIEVVSKDYDTSWKLSEADLQQETHADAKFLLIFHLLKWFLRDRPFTGFTLEITSGSPPGAGLGGSSSMAITVAKALREAFFLKVEDEDLLTETRRIEAMILGSGPTGYQDYFPALHGGILALKSDFSHINKEQLYSLELKNYLEKHFSLIYSGQARLSGINNWEVYKRFFDDDHGVIDGLTLIRDISLSAYQCIKAGDYPELMKWIKKEGETREMLFNNILTDEMRLFKTYLEDENPEAGIKICGAGGGGCFLAFHPEGKLDLIQQSAEKLNMSVLEFKVEGPKS